MEEKIILWREVSPHSKMSTERHAIKSPHDEEVTNTILERTASSIKSEALM